ncbi:hypothetical protein Hte_007415 [Hypoxylon texense]
MADNPSPSQFFARILLTFCVFSAFRLLPDLHEVSQQPQEAEEIEALNIFIYSFVLISAFWPVIMIIYLLEIEKHGKTQAKSELDIEGGLDVEGKFDTSPGNSGSVSGT